MKIVLYVVKIYLRSNYYNNDDDIRRTTTSETAAAEVYRILHWKRESGILIWESRENDNGNEYENGTCCREPGCSGNQKLIPADFCTVLLSCGQLAKRQAVQRTHRHHEY